MRRNLSELCRNNTQNKTKERDRENLRFPIVPNSLVCVCVFENSSSKKASKLALALQALFKVRNFGFWYSQDQVRYRLVSPVPNRADRSNLCSYRHARAPPSARWLRRRLEGDKTAEARAWDEDGEWGTIGCNHCKQVVATFTPILTKGIEFLEFHFHKSEISIILFNPIRKLTTTTTKSLPLNSLTWKINETKKISKLFKQFTQWKPRILIHKQTFPAL